MCLIQKADRFGPHPKVKIRRIYIISCFRGWPGAILRGVQKADRFESALIFLESPNSLDFWGYVRSSDVIGQKSKRSLFFLVPDFNDSEEMLLIGNCLVMEENNLILEDTGCCRNLKVLDDLEGGIVF